MPERRIQFDSDEEGSAIRQRPPQLARSSEAFPEIPDELAEERIVPERFRHLDALVTLGTVATSVAHELNNPLAYLLASVEIASTRLNALRDRTRAAGPVDPDLLRAIAALRDALDGASRVRTILGDVGAIARGSPGSRKLVDVHQVTDAALRIVAAELRHRAEVVKEYGSTPLVVACESRLLQVFINLLVNSAQAIEAGRPRENTVCVRTGTGPSGQAVIEILDSGAGIAPEDLPRVFEAFFTTKQDSGTGLGLALSQDLVRELGGDISIESPRGKGTCVTVTLPPARVSRVTNG